MNKNILLISLAILGGMFLTGSVLAATAISFSPANVNVTSGETFNMVVSVNPQEVKNYTVKTEIEFPADLLEVKSFSFGSNWMPLSQSGYDLIDNANGLLIKTAGYPGGIPISATFGTVSFSAKKSGNGVIKLGSNSMALDSENQDVLSSSLTQTAVSIVALTPVAPASEAPSLTYPDEEIGKEDLEEVETIEGDVEEEIVTEEKTDAETAEESAQLAGIAAIWEGLKKPVVWIILGIALLVVWILIVVKKRRKK